MTISQPFAGIRVKNYKTLFEGCRSKKSKADKLLQLLQENGLKGNPTAEKCRKLKKKLERQREVAELSLANIIDTPGAYFLPLILTFPIWY